MGESAIEAENPKEKKSHWQADFKLGVINKKGMGTWIQEESFGTINVEKNKSRNIPGPLFNKIPHICQIITNYY